MKIIALVTEDFKVFYDLVKVLKREGIPFASLSLKDYIPPNVGSIITTRPEAKELKTKFDETKIVIAADDITSTIRKAQQALREKEIFEELIIGIDPGRKPGLAVIGDGETLQTLISPSPEEVCEKITNILEIYPHRNVRIRIGHGDQIRRNRIINSLSDVEVKIEIVDERSTTRGTRRTEKSDKDAAVDIACSEGYPARKRYDITPTKGEIRDIQRRSRLKSGGKLTISKELAVKVAKGKMTLEEAIEENPGKKNDSAK